MNYHRWSHLIHEDDNSGHLRWQTWGGRDLPPTSATPASWIQKKEQKERGHLEKEVVG